ncbi:hypothetical protein ACFWDF_34555 [Streptomyces diastaticus]|uniref:hypothetical protein n=1 Tax=Streptomyces diastaticus TaxID=1956 RepID=UPI0036751527
MPEPLTVTEDQVRALRAALDALLPDERITQLTDERDRARRWAVGLEQENAELTRRPAEVRAEVLREVANDWTAHCPDHSNDADEVWMDCPCYWTGELRRAANEAEQAAR